MGITYSPPDREALRRAVGSYASSVNVITALDEDGRPVGMTATAFASVSFEPPSVLVCVNRRNRSAVHLRERGRFGINVLSASAHAVSEHCARPGADKGLPEGWLRADPRWYSPCLEGALAFLDCEVDQDHDAGTHAVLIARVRAVGVGSAADPLVHYRGAYRRLSPVGARRALRLPIVPDNGLTHEEIA